MLKVRFTTKENDNFELDLDSSMTIEDCMNKIRAEWMPDAPALMRICLKGRILRRTDTLSSLNLKENDSLVVATAGKVQSNRRPPPPPPSPEQNGPSTTPIPLPPNPESSTGIPYALIQPDTPEFWQRVDDLVDLTRQNRFVCSVALRVCGDVNLAGMYLLQGEIPTPEGMRQISEAQARRENIRRVLLEHPSTLEDIVQFFEKHDPSAGNAYREDVEGFLRSLDLNPAAFDCKGVRNRTADLSGIVGPFEFSQIFGPLQPSLAHESRPALAPPPPMDSALARYEPEEQAAIVRLMSLGNFTLNYVIYVYNLANKDENQAKAELLKELQIRLIK